MWRVHTLEEPESEELGSGAKGKKGELTVIGRLLTQGLDVYLPVVDSGIDCVVDIGHGNYREVQIKYRENNPTFVARKFKPRASFFFVCWLNTRNGDDFWVIPSKTFFELGKQVKVGNRSYIQLGIGREGSTIYNRLAPFHHTFGGLLVGATREVTKVIARARKRVEGEHFSQKDYEKAILAILLEQNRPLSNKEILVEIKERMGARFSEADLELGSYNRTRWESTVRFAIYQGLKKQGLIQAKSKNQWVITAKGRDVTG